jgi:hypothetical protein
MGEVADLSTDMIEFGLHRVHPLHVDLDLALQRLDLFGYSFAATVPAWRRQQV